jgi:hypothetical protein
VESINLIKIYFFNAFFCLFLSKPQYFSHTIYYFIVFFLTFSNLSILYFIVHHIKSLWVLQSWFEFIHYWTVRWLTRLGYLPQRRQNLITLKILYFLLRYWTIWLFLQHLQIYYFLLFLDLWSCMEILCFFLFLVLFHIFLLVSVHSLFRHIL